MPDRTEKSAGFAGQQSVVVPGPVLKTALRERPLLRGLIIAAAGYFPKAAGHLQRRPQGFSQAIVVYCVRGGGWCELEGRRHTVRPGDLLVLPPGVPHALGAHAANPWTIHWAHAAGANLPDYLGELGVSCRAPLVSLGEQLELARLFNEIVAALGRGFSFPDLLHASHTFAHLLALAIRLRHQQRRDASGAVEKVAQAIVYMSEHVDQTLRVSALAALANLSRAHFSVLFRQQTGCSPRGYLRLLRIHRACELLRGSTLSIKEIAFRLGYQDPFHFSRQFKAFQGLSPTAYRAHAD